jgi:hypothetical protein
MTANSLAALAVEANPSSMPASFDGDANLFMLNLFLMTAMFFLGVMMAGKQGRRIWAQRHYDHPTDPISLYRIIVMLAGAGVALRCGSEAMLLWGWNTADPETTARVVMAKRWIDPIAIMCGVTWMAIVVLAEPGLEHQLRKAPLPVDMWSRWAGLVRAGGVIILSFVAALAAVVLR